MISQESYRPSTSFKKHTGEAIIPAVGVYGCQLVGRATSGSRYGIEYEIHSKRKEKGSITKPQLSTIVNEAVDTHDQLGPRDMTSRPVDI